MFSSVVCTTTGTCVLHCSNSLRRYSEAFSAAVQTVGSKTRIIPSEAVVRALQFNTRSAAILILSHSKRDPWPDEAWIRNDVEHTRLLPRAQLTYEAANITTEIEPNGRRVSCKLNASRARYEPNNAHKPPEIVEKNESYRRSYDGWGTGNLLSILWRPRNPRLVESSKIFFSSSCRCMNLQFMPRITARKLHWIF